MRVLYVSFLFWVMAFPENTSAQNLSPQEYIETYKEIAVEYMEQHGCPASIILAIAMHESANGNSKVAKNLNNHFGIKGSNNETSFRSAYKGYHSISESYADFISYLKRRKQTNALFETQSPQDYRGWVQGIAKAGYAQSPQWSNHIIRTIERHKLYELDGGILIAESTPEETENTMIHIVTKGDTLYDLARKHGTTVEKLRLRNSIRGSKLQIGQKLLITEKNTSS